MTIVHIHEGSGQILVRFSYDRDIRHLREAPANIQTVRYNKNQPDTLNPETAVILPANVLPDPSDYLSAHQKWLENLKHPTDANSFSAHMDLKRALRHDILHVIRSPEAKLAHIEDKLDKFNPMNKLSQEHPAHFSNIYNYVWQFKEHIERYLVNGQYPDIRETREECMDIHKRNAGGYAWITAEHFSKLYITRPQYSEHHPSGKSGWGGRKKN